MSGSGKRCVVVVLGGLSVVLGGAGGSCTPAGPQEEVIDRYVPGEDLEAPPVVFGELTVRNFTVPAGQTTRVTGDVVVNASGDVVIDGAIVADEPTTAGGNGPAIRIFAQGSVVIAGTVQAGPGAGGIAGGVTAGIGGPIVLNSALDLTIGDNAAVIAGSGGEGGDGGSGGPGGTGGDLVLVAGQTLTVRGVLTIGNGGDGGLVDENVDLTLDAPLGGDGGSSGALFASAAAYDWLGFDPAAEAVDATVARITGGRGGDGASTEIQLTEPGVATSKTANARSVSVTIPWVESCVMQGKGCMYQGPRGGDGYLSGGDGGSVFVSVPDLFTKTVSPLVALVIAGNGGNVTCDRILEYPRIANINARGGNGGNAGAKGGVWYGQGCEARAYGGDGGSVLCGVLGQGGNGGNATAAGGHGANGADGECITPEAGESGGDGGYARAEGGRGGSGHFGGNGGNAVAQGGHGGNGGYPGGAGGRGSEADAAGGSPGGYEWESAPAPSSGTSSAAPGNTGSSAGDCPPIP